MTTLLDAPPSSPAAAPTPVAARPARRARWWVEVGLIALFLYLYDALRRLAPSRRGLSFHHAHQVMDIERTLHLDHERWVNHLFVAVHPLAVAADYWYVLAHEWVTGAVLLVLWWARPSQYRWLRTALFLTSMLALAGFWQYPLAPPRFQPGFVDTVVRYHTFGGWSSQAVVSKAADEFAAMPSLHVAWALWVGVVGVILTRRPWLRALAVAYPVLTTLVVIGTANHYLVDVVAGAGCLAASLVLARLLSKEGFRVRRRQPTAVTAERRLLRRTILAGSTGRGGGE